MEPDPKLRTLEAYPRQLSMHVFTKVDEAMAALVLWTALAELADPVRACSLGHMACDVPCIVQCWGGAGLNRLAGGCLDSRAGE